MAEQIIFYVLAAIIVFCSIMAVTTQKIIRSATFLLFVLLGTAGLYLLLNYHFLMAVQIAVYAGGGVMVLFIFAILLTNEPGGRDVKFEKPGRMFIAALASLAGLAICGHIIFYNVDRFYTYVTKEELHMQDIGMAMMGTDKYQYLLPFEAISILLLACIIGGIMIARKR